MPGRISAAARQQQRNSAAATTTSRKSSSRNSADIPDEGENTSLRQSICQVFSDAQKSTTGHRKLVISLRKIQEECAYEPATQKSSSKSEDFEAQDFDNEVVRCILRILAVKKAEAAGDRVIRFLGTFLQAASAKDEEIVGTSDADIPTGKLATSILITLLPLITAKDKTIRFRATQITSHIINSLDTLDGDLYQMLRTALLKRLHDKEAPVRLQAVYGLNRLAADPEDQNREDGSDDEDPGVGVLEKLLNILQHDPSADVRRNLLINLPITKEVLPYLLERARDLDGSTRRALYAKLLPTLGDFRHLSLTHREKLLRWGLRDRDENVRKATARLFYERWIEDCAALPAALAADGAEQDPSGQKRAADPSLDALLELLERIDIVNSGGEGGIAQTAMQEFWAGRPDYVDYVSFPENFWDELSPELAFVARSFNDHCRSSGKEDGHNGPRALDAMLEDKLPEVTRFAYLLEREMNRLLETVRLAATGEDEDAEEDSVQCEFVVEQMLHMALTFDYSDEVGRRKMNGLMREALALADLPEEATRLVVEVLRLVCGGDASGENEFCGVILEAIAEVHDTIMGDGESAGDASSTSIEESFHSASSEVSSASSNIVLANSKKLKKQNSQQTEADAQTEEEKAIREIMVNMKCLHIAQCMLQNVGCDLEDNVHLVTMLNNLVVPAVRSQEVPIRERGLVCLGLCCLLGKNLAEENLTLFLHCFAKGHPALQAIAIQIISDVLITHPSLLAAPSHQSQEEADDSTSNESPQLRPVLKAFSKSLKSEDPIVQSTGATALAKTMLSRLITSSDLLKQLVVAFFDPDTANNTQLRQGLSYFLPVYCHSRAENASKMTDVACGIISKLAAIRDTYLEDADVAEDEDEMVSLTVVGNLLLDWTDPRKIVGFAEATSITTSALTKSAAGELHFRLAENILDRLVCSQVNKDERKVLFSILGKLHLPAEGCDGERLRTILELIAEAVETRVATDATARNIVTKLQTHLLKLMHDFMTTERGGGGDEITVLETTEMPVRSRMSAMTAVEEGEDESTQLTSGKVNPSLGSGEADVDEEEEYSDATQLQREMRDTTIGAPDAEGTRVQLGSDDTEMSGLTDDE
ncbi:hypothetical protein K431DRAFT_312816 [Polychaeton citri CBS 116435]|uniref:Nuclear condensin complex subunit 3 C-terminal domain-containing protein n=1 Tax=Polychaeton citri CBS 116435 TaxID=1314669 RepID=A0A9P4QA31_9PEZI|nr:hypothetical protein K431DRAFT_312816 [Polychaeton citri CBS 116435]